jgi:hypothetical protein
MNRLLLAPALALTAPATLWAQTAADTTTTGAPAPDTTAHVTLGGFVDGYYAYDFGRPPGRTRAFTTQAAQHDELAVNLAFVEARYSATRVRARIALQAGTSVQANYAAEPDSLAGTTNFLPLVQEATAGFQAAPSLWIDGGIFLSHIGSEGWISSDNPTYTRSLVAEYSPYYEAGVKATWQATPALVAQFDVVNGWQNITENNGGKAAGVRLDLAASPRVTLSYANFVGREASAATGEQGTRIYNDVSAKWTAGTSVVIGTVDVGTEGGDTWYGASLVGRTPVTPKVMVNGRVERFDDSEGVVAPGLRTWGASAGVDVSPVPNVFWRTELRSLFGAQDAVFPSRDAAGGLSKSNTVVVTSLAVHF